MASTSPSQFSKVIIASKALLPLNDLSPSLPTRFAGKAYPPSPQPSPPPPKKRKVEFGKAWGDREAGIDSYPLPLSMAFRECITQGQSFRNGGTVSGRAMSKRARKEARKREYRRDQKMNKMKGYYPEVEQRAAEAQFSAGSRAAPFSFFPASSSSTHLELPENKPFSAGSSFVQKAQVSQVGTYLQAQGIPIPSIVDEALSTSLMSTYQMINSNAVGGTHCTFNYGAFTTGGPASKFASAHPASTWSAPPQVPAFFAAKQALEGVAAAIPVNENLRTFPDQSQPNARRASHERRSMFRCPSIRAREMDLKRRLAVAQAEVRTYERARARQQEIQRINAKLANLLALESRGPLDEAQTRVRDDANLRSRVLEEARVKAESKALLRSLAYMAQQGSLAALIHSTPLGGETSVKAIAPTPEEPSVIKTESEPTSRVELVPSVEEAEVAIGLPSPEPIVETPQMGTPVQVHPERQSMIQQAELLGETTGLRVPLVNVSLTQLLSGGTGLVARVLGPMGDRDPASSEQIFALAQDTFDGTRSIALKLRLQPQQATQWDPKTLPEHKVDDMHLTKKRSSRMRKPKSFYRQDSENQVPERLTGANTQSLSRRELKWQVLKGTKLQVPKFSAQIEGLESQQI